MSPGVGEHQWFTRLRTRQIIKSRRSCNIARGGGCKVDAATVVRKSTACAVEAATQIDSRWSCHSTAGYCEATIYGKCCNVNNDLIRRISPCEYGNLIRGQRGVIHPDVIDETVKSLCVSRTLADSDVIGGSIVSYRSGCGGRTVEIKCSTYSGLVNHGYMLPSPGSNGLPCSPKSCTRRYYPIGTTTINTPVEAAVVSTDDSMIPTRRCLRLNPGGKRNACCSGRLVDVQTRIDDVGSAIKIPALSVGEIQRWDVSIRTFRGDNIGRGPGVSTCAVGNRAGATDRGFIEFPIRNQVVV